MRARVFKSTGSFYVVQTEENTFITCRLRGRIRLAGIKETNPVAVGDWVTLATDGKEWVIADREPRANQILRQSVKKTGHAHVLAANVTQALVMATRKQPRTSLGFIDRFLMAAESYGIPQTLVFNKCDLLTPSEWEEVQKLSALYASLGVSVFTLSAPADDLTPLLHHLQHHTTLIAGHSGVGKSTLLNRLSPLIQQAVGDISRFSEKGTHTTTFAEMFWLAADTYVIDTPGIKEWALVDMRPGELADYMPEMRALRNECRFGARCLHVREPHCAVLRAVEEGRIARSRYESYLSVLQGEDNRR